MPKSLHAELAARSDRDGRQPQSVDRRGPLACLLGEDGAGGTGGRARVPRELRVALIVNAVVIAVAAAIAIVLIVIAWN